MNALYQTIYEGSISIYKINNIGPFHYLLAVHVSRTKLLEIMYHNNYVRLLSSYVRLGHDQM